LIVLNSVRPALSSKLFGAGLFFIGLGVGFHNRLSIFVSIHHKIESVKFLVNKRIFFEVLGWNKEILRGKIPGKVSTLSLVVFPGLASLGILRSYG